MHSKNAQDKARAASIFLFRERQIHLVLPNERPERALGQGDGTCQFKIYHRAAANTRGFFEKWVPRRKPPERAAFCGQERAKTTKKTSLSTSGWSLSV